ncbi:hypothetical protein V4E86_16770 [Burkholderia pseudomallei]|uniref:hypothetical protein n=1 Tax=Burkholderia pseudomallei TaxID=28450 RepID=UPI0004053119|nr:hypothetical protein [Burkholderia pseudomallei]MBD2911092.1 hypothetical protein [Burkholderia pseudomallei]MBD2922793.1 hypothetical protein [Burkholderia pseudomallei]MBD2929700.1 hypothetical protein [Burkholderia pseudomallei]MBD2966127.1 hypothetical protein [Burkholderia pseudomallei]MBF3412511.1 hypothetical protein [Burkholderia pseudomallei]
MQYPENTNVFGDSIGGKSRRDTGIRDERLIILVKICSVIAGRRIDARGGSR